MIPYPELASALARWRMRNGLPTTVAAPPPVERPLIPPTPPSSAARPAAIAPPVATPPVAAPPRAPGPPAPPTPPGGRTTVFGVPPPPAAVIAAAAAAARPPTNLPEDEGVLDADVLDDHHAVAEDQYENEGDDFAMTFGGPPKAASGSIGGAPDAAIATSPHPPLEDPFGAPTAAVPSGAWPEVAEAREWPPEQTNATAFGWGQGYRPPSQSADEEDSTIVGGGKPKG